MNSSSVAAFAIRPRSSSRSSWRRRICRGEASDRLAVAPGAVGHQHDRRLLPGDGPQGVEVGLHLEVPVTLVPRAHLVAVDRVHVDVDGEQVAAALGPGLEHFVEEVGSGQSFALEASFHVGDRQQDGVDLACRDRRA